MNGTISILFNFPFEKIGFKIDYAEMDSSGTFEWLVIGKLRSKNIDVKGDDSACLTNLTADEISEIRTKADYYINNNKGANALYVIRK